jgi:hypothetical protein
MRRWWNFWRWRCQFDPGTHRNCTCSGTCTDARTCPGACTNAHSGTDACTNAHSGTDACTDACTDTCTHSHSYSNADAYSDSDAYSDADAYSHSHSAASGLWNAGCTASGFCRYSIGSSAHSLNQ